MQTQQDSGQGVRYELVAGKPGYRVGDDGTAWSRMGRGRGAGLADTWRPMKATPQSRGHMMLCLGKGNYRFLHRLVLEAFAGPCPEGMECRHLDGNPGNNRLDNLAWGTRQENQADSARHGTAYMAKGKHLGEDHPCAKIDTATVHRVMEARRRGLGAKAICRELGLPERMRGAVQGVFLGQSWNHVTGLPPYAPQSHQVGPRKRTAEGRGILAANDRLIIISLAG